MTWPRRYLSLTCYRYMSGRPTSPVFNFALAQRPGNLWSYYNSGQWTPPTFNVIAQCADFLQAKIFKNRPFTQVTPLAGDFRSRIKAKKLTRWLDAMYHDLGLWSEIEMCGIDAMTFGTGVLKVHEGLNKKIAITRVLPDELLVNEEEALYTTPPSMIHRVFAHREDLLDRYGDDPEAAEAIKSAKSVFPGFYFGADLNTRDIVPYLEGYRLRYPDGTPGKRVVAVGNKAVEIEKYDCDHYPFAVLKYRQLSTGYFGQGLAEQLLGFQKEINRLFSAIWESNRRMAWPRVLVDTASRVQDSALADKAGGIVRGNFSGGISKPEFIYPPFASDQQMQWLNMQISLARQRARISDQSAAGQKPAGLSSGLAIEKWAMVEDAGYVDLGQRQEDFCTRISELLVEQGERLKPKVRAPGRRIDEIAWNDIDLKRDSYFLRAFPMSSLPQTIGGRQQIIDTWFANGQITKANKMRLEQTYDLQNWEDLATAAQDFVECTLDDMIEHGEFIPPSPFALVTGEDGALAMAQSRWLLEMNQGTPQDRTDLILQYVAVLEDFLPQIPQTVGVQGPAGFPAAPPVQAAPGIGAPQQPGAA